MYGHALIINPSQGMYQEIHPYRANNIDGVEINTSLLMMTECMCLGWVNSFAQVWTCLGAEWVWEEAGPLNFVKSSGKAQLLHQVVFSTQAEGQNISSIDKLGLSSQTRELGYLWRMPRKDATQLSVIVVFDKISTYNQVRGATKNSVFFCS